MAIKIESRFSPSVVRAAQSLEAVVALSKVPFGSELSKRAQGSFSNLLADVTKRASSFVTLQGQQGYEVEECMREMQADRRRKAQEAKARREKHARAREELTFA